MRRYKMKQKRFFRFLRSDNRFLIMLLLWLMIFIFLLIFLGAYAHNTQSYHAQLSSSTETAIHIAFEKINDAMRTGESIIDAHQLTLRDNFRDIDQLELKQISDALKQLCSTSPFIQECVMYKKDGEFYITSQGTVSKDDFFRHQYIGTEDDAVFWENVMGQYYTPSIIPVTDYQSVELPTNTSQPLFVVPKIFSVQKVGILIFVNENQFLGFCGIADTAPELKVTLYDKTGTVALANHKDKRPFHMDLLNDKPVYRASHSYFSTTYATWFEYQDMVYQFYISNPYAAYTTVLIALLFAIIALGMAHTIGVAKKAYYKLLQLAGNPEADTAETADTLLASLTARLQGDAILPRLQPAILAACAFDAAYYHVNRATVDLQLSDLINRQAYAMAIFVYTNHRKLQLSSAENPEDILIAHGIDAITLRVTSSRRYLLLIAPPDGCLPEEQSLDQLLCNQICALQSDIVVIRSSVFSQFSSLYDARCEAEAMLPSCTAGALGCVVSSVSGATTNIRLPSQLENADTTISRLLFSSAPMDLIPYLNTSLEEAIASGMPFSEYQFLVQSLYAYFVNALTMCDSDNDVFNEVDDMFAQQLAQCAARLDAEGLKTALINTVFCIVPQLHTTERQDDKSDILRYIHQNYKSDLYLEKIAGHFGYQTKYFSYYFKREFKVGFNEYLTQLRVEEGKRLLKNTDKSIADIASELGYGNHASFSIAFKKATGLSPSTFREP